MSQKCLSHELSHITLTDSKSNDKNGNKRKRKKSKKLKIVPNESAERKKMKEAVTTSLLKSTSGLELPVLCQIFQPTPEDLLVAFNKICSDLNEEFCKRNENWVIYPFGSTTMGLSFKSSDFDLYVYPSNENDENSDEVYKTLDMILRKSRKFANILTISKARVPIVKCTHIETSYNLDINVSSVLGAYSNYFIGKVFCLDARIHPYILLIKIWAKLWEIAGTGRITNYCLMLIGICYLQCCKPPVIPSFKKLQENVPEFKVKGINYAFNSNYVHHTRNNQNIKQLLEGFFKFCSELDFSSVILSPYLGTIINREDFISKKFRFYEYDNLLQYLQLHYPPTNKKREIHGHPINVDSLVVIQDPFFLNHNNSLSVGKNAFKLFKIHAVHAYSVLSATPNKGENLSQMLIRLLFENPELPSKVFVREPRQNEDLSIMIFRMSPIDSELLYVRSYLRNRFRYKTFDKIEINKFWIEKIIEFTKNVLVDIFGMELIDLNMNEGISKIFKSDLQTDVHFCKYSLKCELKANVDTWSNRKINVKRTFSAFLAEQLEITKIFKNSRNKKNFPANFHCRLTIEPEQDFSTLVLKLKDLIPQTRKSNSQQFFCQITLCIRHFYKAYFEKLEI